jgi:hypothetical protein
MITHVMPAAHSVLPCAIGKSIKLLHVNHAEMIVKQKRYPTTHPGQERCRVQDSALNHKRMGEAGDDKRDDRFHRCTDIISQAALSAGKAPQLAAIASRRKVVILADKWLRLRT